MGMISEKMLSRTTQRKDSSSVGEGKIALTGEGQWGWSPRRCSPGAGPFWWIPSERASWTYQEPVLV